MGFTSVKEVCVQSPLKVGRYSVGLSSGLIYHVWFSISHDMGVLRGVDGLNDVMMMLRGH